MKEALRKAAEALFPRTKVVADPFQVIADSNKRMDEARRIEQDVHWRRRVNPSRPVLPELVPTGVEGAEGPVVSLPRISLRGGAEPSGRVKIPKKIFLIGGEKLGEQAMRKETNSWISIPALRVFTGIRKRVSYGLRNVEVYWRKMLLGFVPSRSYFHTL